MTILCARACLAAAMVLGSAAASHAFQVYTLSGQITDAEALTFAVINGNLLASNPEPGDLPLSYTGTLELPTGDAGSSTATLRFSGSFTSPTRSYVFDVAEVDLPVEVLQNDAQTLSIVDSFLDFDDRSIDLMLDKTTGIGTWSWRDGSGVPTSPVMPRSAEASIASFSFIPEPCGLAMALPVALAALRRRR
ncbi:MAG: hypothetical protein AAGJ46_03130 [Planctomycetota bacterium]